MENRFKFSKINFVDIQKEHISELKDDTAKLYNQIYSEFTYNYFNFNDISQNDIQKYKDYIIKELFYFYKENKFITYQIFQNEKSVLTNSIAVFCTEKQCYIFQSIDSELIDLILTDTKLAIIDVNSKNDFNLQEEIGAINNFLFKVTKKTKFEAYTFNAIIIYLIYRFFYPSSFFKDKSFFEYDDKYNFSNELESFYQSKNINSIDHKFFNLKNEINQKFFHLKRPNNDLNIPQIHDFKEEEFIVLRDISSNFSIIISLVFHIPSLRIFAMRKTPNPAQREIDFCRNYSHRCFTKFYGFVKDGKEIIGFIYEYMSNGTLYDWVIKNKANSFFILTTIIRLYQGLSFLQSNSLVHRDLKPQNILINHDNIPFISDFETIRPINNKMQKDEKGVIVQQEFTNEVGSNLYESPEQDEGKELTFATDVYSFGQIIYFLFKKSSCFESLEYQQVIKMKKINRSYNINKCSNNIQLLYNKCIKYNPEERPSLSEIQKVIFDETNSHDLLEEHLVNYSIQKIDLVDISQYFAENIVIRFKSDRKEIKKYLDQIYNFYIINYFLRNGSIQPSENEITKSDEINEYYSFLLLKAGDIFYKSDDIQNNVDKSMLFYELSEAKGNDVASLKLGDIYHERKNYKKAKEYYELATKNENSEAYLKLGNLYFNGEGVEKNISIAKTYYEFSAAKDNPDAQLILGNYYKYGFDDDQNYTIALEYYQLSAEKGVSEALLNMGIFYENGFGVKKDKQKAREFYELAACKNNTESLLKLGNLYEHGIGVFIDYKKAVKYYEKAGKDNSEALLKIGNLYEYGGFGIERKIDIARKYYELSAGQNNSDALLKLGNLYCDGKGVQQDYFKAKNYYEQSSALNNHKAFVKLEKMYRYGIGVEKSEEMAKKYHDLTVPKNESTYTSFDFFHWIMYNFSDKFNDKAIKGTVELAKQKDPYSLLQLAFYYEDDIYFEKNLAKAKKIYEYLADQNNDVALFQLAMMYANDHDYIKAKPYFELSAKQNNSDALYALGTFYKTGKGVEIDYEKAKTYFEQSAEQENALAIFQLGEIYEYGLGVEIDYHKAKKYYEICSKLNKTNNLVKSLKFVKKYNLNNEFEYLHTMKYSEISNIQYESKALMKLGNFYWFGLGVKQNYKTAIQFFELAAKQDYCEALCTLGKLYYYGLKVEQDYTKAKNYFESAAKQNPPESLFYIGKMHYDGHGFEQSFTKAKEYYELAAKYDYSSALNNIGYMYLQGKGVKKDYQKAKEYYEQAAEKNNSNSIYSLGYLYLEGFGVKQDYVKAKEYFELAAKQNNVSAIHNLGYLYYHGFGVKQDYVKAKECFELAAKSNNANSFDFLGDIYFYGLGVAKDFSIAKKHYESAVQYGSKKTIISLGILYYERNDNEQDYIKAKNYFELASEKNIPIANYYLGRLYELGKGVEKNLVKAKEYYELAEKQNFHSAMYKLGTFYEQGISVPKDQSEAIKYYKKAAFQNNDNAILQLAIIYSNTEYSDVYIKEAIEYLYFIFNMEKNQQLRNKNGNLYIAYNYFGLIHLIEYQDIEVATKYIKKSAFEEYPRGQNNYGILLQLYNKDQTNAIYFFEKSSKGGCELASYNLGHLYELENNIEKSIQYYIKASEDADKEFEFRGRTIFDQRYERSKKFIICLTNLHLVKYYFGNNPNLSKKYFIKAILMLTTDTYTFSFKLTDSPFAYIKDFIFNYPDFGFSDNEKTSNIKVKKVDSKSMCKKPLKKSMLLNKNLGSNVKEKEQFNRINENMYESSESFEDSPSDLFDYIVQNTENKQLFIDEIQRVIDDMNKILYTTPYDFLFGRMKCRNTKQNYDYLKYYKEINHLFYDGFGIPV